MRSLVFIASSLSAAACSFEGRVAGGGDGAVACTGTADFDGDNVTDSCDSCPHLAVQQRDTDSDGVGDECDPNPQNATETRVLWETFDRPPTGWTIVGNWTFDNGVARHDSDTAELDYISPPLELPNAYAATRVRVEQFGNDEPVPSLGLSTGGIAPKTQYYSCAAGWFYILRERLYAASNWPDGGGEMLDSTGWADSFGTMELEQWVAGDRNLCRGRNGESQGSISVPAGPTTGRVSLYSIDGRGTFEYLFVVKIEP